MRKQGTLYIISASLFRKSTLTPQNKNVFKVFFKWLYEVKTCPCGTFLKGMACVIPFCNYRIEAFQVLMCKFCRKNVRHQKKHLSRTILCLKRHKIKYSLFVCLENFGK